MRHNNAVVANQIDYSENLFEVPFYTVSPALEDPPGSTTTIGGVTCQVMQDDNGGGTGIVGVIFDQVIANGATVNISVFVAQDQVPYINIRTLSDLTADTFIDASDGSLVSLTASRHSNFETTAVDGGYRVSIDVLGDTDEDVRVYFAACDTDSSLVSQIDGTTSAFIGGAQATAGSGVKPYAATSGGNSVRLRHNDPVKRSNETTDRHRNTALRHKS